MSDKQTTDDDPMRTAIYMRGFRNGLGEAAKMMQETKASIRLHAGEMTAQEMRSVMAVLLWKQGAIQALADAEWQRVMGTSA